MSFAQEVERFAKATRQESDRIVRAVTYEWFASVILDTPVGNPSLWKSPAPEGYVGGALRGAWQASQGSPNLTVNGVIDPSGSSTVGSMRTAIGGAGTLTFLTNPLPYARPVEEGWSGQTPEGMVRKNLIRVQSNLRAA